MSKRKFTTLDLFSGAGGFTLGLEAAGFHSVGAIEIDEISGRSYQKNFGKREILRFGKKDGDMSRVSPQEIARQLRRSGISTIDLLVAGPPCQGFSRIGRGKLDSLADRVGAFKKDHRNGLYKKFLDFLEVLKPHSFLFENVLGILNLGGINVAEIVCEAAEEIGYNVSYTTLNSACYGVPQSRERVFIIGYKKSLGIDPEFPRQKHDFHGHAKFFGMKLRGSSRFFIEPEHLNKAGSLLPPVSTKAAFADLPEFTQHLVARRRGKRMRSLRTEFPPVRYRVSAPPNTYCKLMRRWHGFVSKHVQDHFCRWTPRDYRTFALMKPGDKYPDALRIALKRWRQAVDRYKAKGGKRPSRKDFVPPYPDDGFNEKWQKLLPTRPSWTVTAHLSQDTYSHIHFDNKQARGISIREAARLQSFPDAFVFEGNSGDAYRQIGNAVPPLLAKAVGKVIYRQLDAVLNKRPLATRSVVRNPQLSVPAHAW